jgi:hypothetical protein
VCSCKECSSTAAVAVVSQVGPAVERAAAAAVAVVFQLCGCSHEEVGAAGRGRFRKHLVIRGLTLLPFELLLPCHASCAPLYRSIRPYVVS